MGEQHKEAKLSFMDFLCYASAFWVIATFSIAAILIVVNWILLPVGH